METSCFLLEGVSLLGKISLQILKAVFCLRVSTLHVLQLLEFLTKGLNLYPEAIYYFDNFS